MCAAPARPCTPAAGMRCAAAVLPAHLLPSPQPPAPPRLALQVSAAVMAKVVGEGVSEEYGARQLRRTVTRLVEDPLSDAILGQEVRAGEGGEGGWAWEGGCEEGLSGSILEW